MRPIGQALLALLAALWLASTLLACNYADLLDDDDPVSDPTSDDIADAALARKPAATRAIAAAGVHCPGSFRAFKKIIKDSSKDPGDGYQWHHIVNQNPTNRNRFKNRLHCTDNLIALPKAIHGRVTGHFNRKYKWTSGDFVRDVINKRSWRAQYEYGLGVLRDQGVTP